MYKAPSAKLQRIINSACTNLKTVIIALNQQVQRVRAMQENKPPKLMTRLGLQKFSHIFYYLFIIKIISHFLSNNDTVEN